MAPRRNGSREARRPRGRKSRQEKKTFLIVVEGSPQKSEMVYFQELNQLLRSEAVSASLISAKVVAGKGEPNRVLETCLQYRSPVDFDRRFLVVDVDQHTSLCRVLEEARQHEVEAVVTNPQFEQWLWWHIWEGAKAPKELNKELRNAGHIKGKNGKELSPNFPVANFEEAMKHAKLHWRHMQTNKIGPSPSSAIPCLIDALRGRS